MHTADGILPDHSFKISWDFMEDNWATKAFHMLRALFSYG